MTIINNDNYNSFAKTARIKLSVLFNQRKITQQEYNFYYGAIDAPYTIKAKLATCHSVRKQGLEKKLENAYFTMGVMMKEIMSLS